MRDAEPAMGLFWRILKRIFSSLFLAIVTFVGAPAAFARHRAGRADLPAPAGHHPHPQGQPDHPADGHLRPLRATRSPRCSSTTATSR